jgi:hypothetical protein
MHCLMGGGYNGGQDKLGWNIYMSEVKLLNF